MLKPRLGKRDQLEDLEIREGLDGLSPARIATLYRRAPLLRPVDEPAEVWKMFERSSIVLSAWHRGHVVGIARALSDGVLHTYLCDLAVEPDVQRSGVGRALLAELMSRCKGTELVLRDSDLSSSFYQYMGFRRVDNAWVKNI